MFTNNFLVVFVWLENSRTIFEVYYKILAFYLHKEKKADYKMSIILGNGKDGIVYILEKRGREYAVKQF